ncbi:MAG: tetratricopeptide repeat protein [Gemmataceae bacterium]
MADAFRLPPPTAEHRRIASERFEHARQAVAKDNYDYGIQLLLTCCKLDPASMIYRQELRRAQKKKHKNNMRGGVFSVLTTAPHRTKLKSAKRNRDYARVLEHGEEILVRNPWDLGAQLDMAEAADALGLTDMAIFILSEAREKDGNNPTVNRAIARLFEKRGNFAQAIKIWELVRQAVPTDAEATHKAKDLAASETIQRGKYEEVAQSDSPVNALREKRAAALADTTQRELETLQARCADGPTEAQPYLQLAALHKKAGRVEQALTVLQNGLGPTGQSFELLSEIADLELEPFRKNLNLTEEKLKADPDDDDLRKVRVRLLKEINAREIELYRMKADRMPGELSHKLELGVRLLRGGRAEEAIAELQSVRREPRLLGKAAMYLGFAFKQRNNWRLAQRNLEEALKALPNSEEASRKEVLFHLAQGLSENGELAQAVEVGSELANLDYAYRDIGRLLDEWQAKLQKA